MSTRFVPVYFQGESLRGPAQDYVHPDGAQELFDTGLASWSKNGKSLILKRLRGEVKLRDKSCVMGPEVADRALMGSRYHAALIAAWAPTLCWN